MKIIVTGASGRTTRKLIDTLIARGVAPSDLILMSRSLERPEVQDYAAMGASVRFGDFTDPATLPQAFAGGDKMFLTPFNRAPETDLDRGLVRLASPVNGARKIFWIGE